MKLRMILQLSAVTAIALLAFAPSAARADFQFDLGLGNSSGSPTLSSFTGPYAHVNVSLTDSTHAVITFTSLTNSGNIYLMGGQGAVGVNVNATTWTLGSITESNAGTGFTPKNSGQTHGPTDGGAANEDGWGSFNQTIDNFDGFTFSADTIVVNLENTGGTWGDADSVLTGNPSGHLAAAHIFVTADPAIQSNGALTTGYATDGKRINSVPAPSSVIAALSGMALLGLIGVVGYRRRTQAILAA